MNLKRWHWRDVLCWLKLHLSKDGYSVSEMCGGCTKCNRILAACGCLPCPMRFDEPIEKVRFLEDLKKYCRDDNVEWLYGAIKKGFDEGFKDGRLDIRVEAKSGDWGDEIFNVMWDLKKKSGYRFERSDMEYRHEFDWNSEDPYKDNPLIIHWTVDLKESSSSCKMENQIFCSATASN